ncbi:MAG TPA: hypothetical protein VIG48_07670 [Jatrophihabitans sp.]|jgi:hypothetical protein
MSSPQQSAWAPPPPRTDRPDPAATKDFHHAHEHNRLALILALSIAVVSVLGAIVGWRAETHASRASLLEQDSVAASIAATQIRAQADAEAGKADSNYVHYRRLADQANELSPGACGPDGSRRTLSDFDAGALCQTQVQFSGYSSTFYVDQKGNFEQQRYAADYVAAQNERDPLDPEVVAGLAETERHHEDAMLYLSLVLVLSLALLTLARVGKSVPARLLLAVPGWLCLTGSAVFLIATEV